MTSQLQDAPKMFKLRHKYRHMHDAYFVNGEIIERDSDVEFLCQDGGILKAHKIILALASNFFVKLFKSQKCGKMTTVNVPDIDTLTMQLILKLAYKEVSISMEITSDIADHLTLFGMEWENFSIVHIHSIAERKGDININLGGPNENPTVRNPNELKRYPGPLDNLGQSSSQNKRPRYENPSNVKQQTQIQFSPASNIADQQQSESVPLVEDIEDNPESEKGSSSQHHQNQQQQEMAGTTIAKAKVVIKETKDDFVPPSGIGNSPIAVMECSDLLNINTIRDAYNCQFCGRKGKKLGFGAECLKSHNIFRCSLCFNTYKSKDDYSLHLKLCHGSGTEGRLNCPCCNKYFANAGQVTKHLYSVHWFPRIRKIEARTESSKNEDSLHISVDNIFDETRDKKDDKDKKVIEPEPAVEVVNDKPQDKVENVESGDTEINADEIGEAGKCEQDDCDSDDIEDEGENQNESNGKVPIPGQEKEIEN